MTALARRLVGASALLASVVSVLSLVVLFRIGPDSAGEYLVANNALFVLWTSTPIAAGLLAVALHGWGRVLALCAFVPAAAAVLMLIAYELISSLRSPILAVIGFTLVELALPAAAVLVGVAAIALVVQIILDRRRARSDARAVLTSASS